MELQDKKKFILQTVERGIWTNGILYISNISLRNDLVQQLVSFSGLIYLIRVIWTSWYLNNWSATWKNKYYFGTCRRIYPDNEGTISARICKKFQQQVFYALTINQNPSLSPYLKYMYKWSEKQTFSNLVSVWRPI